MPRRCTICHNPQHEEIAVSLFRDGTRATARRFHYRYRLWIDTNGICPPRFSKRNRPKWYRRPRRCWLVSNIFMRESEKIAAAAKLEMDWPAATSALREARSCLELLGRLRGELQSGANVRIGVAVNVNAQQSGDRTEAELDLAIAQHVAAATNNFDLEEIARLSALVYSASDKTNTSPGHGSQHVLDCDGQI